ncbi:tRNA (guanosine(46)-N7)-methyltransferase TrmB [Clostridium botulinum]|uniref:tRNA (guanosine(46)-N7)-methyltransferase TrmB n=1 Tax=Clostridium botulinum TaxID=1491 RepID=UPI000D122EC8|nr:tRNA (guanosine(46)-N7)-methyltransferase TrmB [Clostridium botulinum]AVQ46053.1 tRNA (guanosine(46)-N7)-methyltransferase TrmB [Clostridium botulinum]AVQ49670.1 tRNA (guanosine(46)-N7)-methyltransferase TrmB [Clostridium botulinum]
MRLRKKWWARPEIEASDKFAYEPKDLKGKWNKEFNNNNEIHLELGCGRGGFISQLVEKNKDINYVGIDLKDEVIVYAIRKVEKKEEEVKRKLKNIKFITMNIMGIAEVFDEDEISKIYINFCNPWPKERHNKRRLTHTKLLTEYKKFLKPNTEIWFKTDDKELFEDSQEYFKESGFNIEYITYDLHNSDFKENIKTEYETKFESMGMKIMFLRARLL